MVAKRDFVDDGDQQMKIKLFVPDHVDPVDWNCYKNITDINVCTVSSHYIKPSRLYSLSYIKLGERFSIPVKKIRLKMVDVTSSRVTIKLSGCTTGVL